MFRKVLIANRGEIACRVMRTCQRLGMKTVAVYSDADERAPHTRMGDEAVRIGDAPVRDSYLRADAIVEAALKTGVDAIHPGYGLLSENAGFARMVQDAGIIFVGPDVEAMEVFGNKLLSRELAKSQNVPVLPATACVVAVDGRTEAEQACSIGYPLMVKAVGGGGGIGMQVVSEPSSLARAVRACSDRARGAFGDARVYFERCVEFPRHIEVQVVCDGHGGVAALGERECSVQRRHQKVIEESPSPAAFFAGPDGMRRRSKLYECAIRLLGAAGYVNAGTVEFLASANGEFYFLEVNARLQVEHAVTEAVTGVDLVEVQLRVAEGERVADKLSAVEPRGHAVEARIYAEDPSRMFLPQPGTIQALRWPEQGADTMVRVETGVESGSVMSPHYDPLIAKIIAWGEDRKQANRRLGEALASTRIELVGARGPTITNLAFLRSVLVADEYVRGDYDTRLVATMLSAGRA